MKIIKEILTSIKDILIEYIKSRMFPVTLAILVMFSLLVHRLFVLQIVEGQNYEDSFQVKTLKTLKIDSIRGNFYDCNGKLLAYNKLSYNLTFGNDTALAVMAKERGVSENTLKNEIVFKTISILEKNGDSISTDFPIVYMNNIYTFTVSGNTLNNFLKDVYAVNSYDALTEEQKNSSPEDVINYLRYGNAKTKNFDVSSEYTNVEALKIIACRYKLWLNRFQQYVPVNIATDISEESYSAIKEHSDELLGMEVTVSSLRVYNDAKYFASIIGYVGKASTEDLEELNSNDKLEVQYKSDDVVGKTGLEKYYESELRGKAGEKQMYVDNLGKVLDVINDTPAEAGNNIYLSIDSDLQEYCYDMLEKEISVILLNNIQDIQYAPYDNSDHIIPISDVYFALFNNNYITLEKMESDTASALEKETLAKFKEKQADTIANLKDIIETKRTPLSELKNEYKNYMEYILEMLSAKGIFKSSMIETSDPMFKKYIAEEMSLAEYLDYAISVEAIDISSIDMDNSYYSSSEIYDILCKYIINSLSTDTEFDKLMIKVLVQSNKITGKDVVNLIYQQNVLESIGDTDYAAFKKGDISAYEFMIKKIKNIEITPAMLALDPCSGAVVITDVNSGQVKALVSYPSYDNNYLTNTVDSDYYNTLLNDKTNPLYNRSTKQRNAPGSTFKIISSIAAVEEGVLQVDGKVQTRGIFDKVYGSPRCWIYKDKTKRTHGTIGISQALNHSCNYFFYEMGYRLATKSGTYSDTKGLNALSKYATMFGLDDKSGIELDESEPKISDRDAVTSAIGQGTHNYTPTQLSKYVTAVANSGTVYDLSLLDHITDYEGETVTEYKAVIDNTVNISSTLWNSVHTGMRLVVSDHLRDNRLLNKIRVRVAGKTGTAQENKNRPNHALFISYAPYEKPETSVTVVIQNGYNSGNAAELAGFIYAYMYDKDALAGVELNGSGEVSD